LPWWLVFSKRFFVWNLPQPHVQEALPAPPFPPFAFHFPFLKHKKMKVRHHLYLLLSCLLGLLLTACDDDPVESLGQYEFGIFVVNEGGFGGTGTITWYDLATRTARQDIYGAANNGAALGEFPQSLVFHKGKGYICMGASTKIIVVDGNTFVYEDTIGGLANPRHLLPLDDSTALVTQWGRNGLDGTVAKVDLSTKKVLQTSAIIGAGPERMLRLNDDEVLISNSGGFGVDSTVVTFSLSTFSVKSRTTLPGKNPSGLARLGDNGPVFALCKGSFLDATPKGWFGPLSGSGGTEVPPYAEDLCRSGDGSTLFFAAIGRVYQWRSNGLSVAFEQPAYGLNCSSTNMIYCADAKDFNSAGEVVIRSDFGGIFERFPTGIAPGEIVIK
jgi:hypothetical protein